MISYAHISRVEFQSGETLDLTEDSVVVLVGPNNAGKSQALRDIFQSISDEQASPVAIKRASVNFCQSIGDVHAWVDRNCQRKTDSLGGLEGPGGSIYFNPLKENEWPPKGKNREIGKQFVVYATCAARLQLTEAKSSIDLVDDIPKETIHHLQKNAVALDQVSKATSEAFGYRLQVEQLAGSRVYLRVGRANVALTQPRDPEELAVFRKRCPPLESQGDGIRSFVGCLASAISRDASLVLIDEPEAFLHPPQARLLGSHLVGLIPSKRQLFIATHDANLLRGIISSTDTNRPVYVVRLQRTGDITQANVIDSAALKLLSKKSLVQHSDLINGLFHDGVTICEADADCRFYSAVASRLPKETSRLDLQWTPSGGKHRVPEMLEILNRMGVPARAIVDFDFLREEALVKKVCLTVGISWVDISDQWKTISDSVAGVVPPSIQDVRNEIDEIFSRGNGKILSEESADEIREAVRFVSPWAKPTPEIT